MAAVADAAAGKPSNSKAEHKAPAAADQKANLTVGRAAAADVDEYCSDDEADSVIRNLNLMSRLNLMTPEWIENRRRRHYEEIALYNRSYDALENQDVESDDEAFTAEFEEWSKRHRASIDFSRVNTVGGESCGVDAVAVYPDFLHAPPKSEDAAAAAVYPAVLRPEEKVHDAGAESSS